jgi:hypothetical protein
MELLMLEDQEISILLDMIMERFLISLAAAILEKRNVWKTLLVGGTILEKSYLQRRNKL